MQQPYKFTNTAPDQMPYCEIYERSKEAFEFSNKQLTREEKNRFFHAMQGNSGHHYFRLMGWCFPVYQYMKKYIVKYKHDKRNWREYYAFDKTCIRSSYYTSSYILKIKEID
jgi:hypothetical protein